MFAMGKQKKIFNSIIFSIAIYVMNILVGAQRSTNVFFHNNTMFSYGFSIMKKVALFRRLLSFIKAITRARAIYLTILAWKLNHKLLSTIFTDECPGVFSDTLLIFFIFATRFTVTFHRAIFLNVSRFKVGLAKLAVLNHYSSRKETAQPFNFALVEGAPLGMAGGDIKSKSGSYPRRYNYSIGGVI